MGENDPNHTSEVEVSVGQTSIRIEGSEEFIRRELQTVLDWVDLTDGEPREGGQESQVEPSRPETQPSLSEVTNESEMTGEEDQSRSELEEVARDLNVDVDKLSDHFYIDEDEQSVHIRNPMEIDPEYALLGYCDIRQSLTGETYHDNSKTKTKLIDQEKVNIERWGGSLLYKLRRNGLIKDDPNSDRQRNKPFKITPKGHEEFVQWIENDG